MLRFALLVVASVVGGMGAGAPVPVRPATESLAAGLSDPAESVRDASSAVLRNRVDALPWLRRAARSADKDTVRRAAALLAPHEPKRQEAVAKAIDACISDGRLDLLLEWHHYWKPENPDDLWSVGPRAAKAGLKLYAERRGPGQPNHLEDGIAARAASGKHRFYDFSGGADPRRTEDGVWHVRADLCDTGHPDLAFASVAGPFRRSWAVGGRFFALGPVEAGLIQFSFLACDGDISSEGRLKRGGTDFGLSVVVCRGNVRGHNAGDVVLLVDGDIDLSGARTVQNSLIRASGTIRLPKAKEAQPINCTIEPHAKNPTAPYKFFEFADVGLTLADDEEGLLVTGVRAGTPFGTCGIAKGDVVRFLDDAPAGCYEEFRRALRRVIVRHGDGLVTVVRGDKILDLPVFFPLPK